MQDDIQKLREIFLADDVDEETRKENLEAIADFERGLQENSDFQRWQQHPVTIALLKQAKKAYVDHSLALARSRELTEAARFSLWAKQDAALWFVSLLSRDVGAEKKNIEAEIKRALALMS